MNNRRPAMAAFFSLQTLQVWGAESVVLYKHRLAKVESVESTLHE